MARSCWSRSEHRRQGQLVALLSLLSALLVSPALLAAPARRNVASSGAARPVNVSHWLRAWQQRASTDPAAASRWANQLGLPVAGEQLEVEAYALTPHWRTADVAKLRTLGIDIRAVGKTRLLLRVQPQQIDVIAAQPFVRWLEPVQRPKQLAVLSEGVAKIGAGAFRCASVGGGKGVQVAVVDAGFAGYKELVGLGELDAPAQWPVSNGILHGSACAETVHDVAPGAALLPYAANSVAELEAWAAEVIANKSVQVVSHSLGWYATSFGDGTGPVCALVSSLRDAGVVFVTAAGNSAAGAMWVGKAQDQDQDGLLEWAANGDEINQFDVYASGPLVVHLDWDAYPATDTDLQLELCVVGEGNSCDLLTVVNDPQTGSQPPHEVLIGEELNPNLSYGLRVRHLGGPLPPAFRVERNDLASPLEYTSIAQTLADPAVCKDALTVAAVHHADWNDGEVTAYSSRGPTWDGRIKPDLAGPTGTATMAYGGPFDGTSASTPHVAGAVALLLGRGKTPEEARIELLASAVPIEQLPKPNPQSGYGRVQLRLDVAKVACDPLLPTKLSCTNPCGTAGTTTCNADCSLKPCEVGSTTNELCDGIDQDCDGVTDEGFTCKEQACTTACGSTGMRGCTGKCQLSACAPPAEICNGADDDCDGQADNGFACSARQIVPCKLPGGGEGGRICTDTCVPGPCEQLEICNRMDDDGDDQVDEGGVCDSGCSSQRTATPPWAGLCVTLGALGVWSRRRQPGRVSRY